MFERITSAIQSLNCIIGNCIHAPAHIVNYTEGSLYRNKNKFSTST